MYTLILIIVKRCVESEEYFFKYFDKQQLLSPKQINILNCGIMILIKYFSSFHLELLAMIKVTIIKEFTRYPRIFIENIVTFPSFFSSLFSKYTRLMPDTSLPSN